MWIRVTTFLIAACAGSVLAYGIFDREMMAWGGLAAALLWLLWDSWRVAHLEAVLRDAQAGNMLAEVPGWWGAVAERVRRLQRGKDQQIAASEQRMKDFLAAIQASPNGVLLLDARNRIEWCNQTAARQLGLNAQRDVDQQIGNLVRDPDFSAYLHAENFDHEVVIAALGASGQRTMQSPLRVSLQLHPYGEGRKLLLTRDVTAIEQADAMRRDFVANVSHEIRTPLTVLSGFIETLQNLPLSEDQRIRYLGLMGQQSERMQTLVSDLLTLSRLEGGTVPSTTEVTSVDALLAQCEQEARALSQLLSPTGSGLQQRLHFDNELGSGASLLGARTELLSAMGNLVSNAVRYTPAGGLIAVCWRGLPEGGAEFYVQDTGPGIAPEHVPRLTERFYRVDRSRSRETGGTGLGLAIVKHVVQRHGGELRVESVLGRGSTFTFSLPVLRVKLVENSLLSKQE